MRRLAVRGLWERGVLQVLAGYFAVGWGLLEFSSWLVARAELPSRVVDVILATWLALMPVAVFLAWRRGRAVAAREGGANGVGARAAGPGVAGNGVEQEPGAPVAIAGAVGAPPPGSVAVLPFLQLGGGEADGFLSDGISEEILSALARVGGLRVASRTSALAYRGKALDVRTIGRELGVRSVLEGSVQRVGERLRVSTRLVDVADGYQLWAGRYDRTMADVFAIEDQIAENVARLLLPVLQGAAADTPRVPRADVKAYEYYLRGRQFLSDSRLKSLRFAREMFRRAIVIDPGYALAHAAVAHTVALECMFYPSCGTDADEAERASARALELDPDLPEAHAARGSALFAAGKLEEAEHAYREALRLQPRCYDALYLYGRMCFQLGRMEEAAALFGRARDVREDYQAAFFAAQSEEALGHVEPARVLYGRALAVVEAHMELNPDDPRAATMRAVSLWRTGRSQEGLDWAERAVTIDPQDAGVRYNAACLFALAGQAERALDWLEDAARVGFGNMDWIRQDPDLASLRGHPRFEALVGPAAAAPAADAPPAATDPG